MSIDRNSIELKPQTKKSDGWTFFADIFGFKAVLEPPHLEVATANLLSYQLLIKRIFEEASNSYDISFVQFSDLVTFHFPAEKGNPESFRMMLEIVSKITEAASRHNFLLRGAITYGSAVVGKDFILGESYLRAYIIESTEIIGPEIIAKVEDLEKAKIADYWSNHIVNRKIKRDKKVKSIVFDYTPFEKKNEISQFHVAELSKTGNAPHILKIWKKIWEKSRIKS